MKKLTNMKPWQNNPFIVPLELAELLKQTQKFQQASWQNRPILLIKAQWGSLILSLQGAQLLHFAIADELPWFWCNTNSATFPAPIRGGVPLCWPWFADEFPPHIHVPMHGIARNHLWKVTQLHLDDQSIAINLKPIDTLDQNLQPNFTLTYDYRGLCFALKTHNQSTQEIIFTQAFHNYFAVTDSFQVSLPSLNHCEYNDKLQQKKVYRQNEPLLIHAPLDRIYHSNKSIILQDLISHRTFTIDKQQSNATVVWYPTKPEPSDICLSQLKHFICVEPACTSIAPTRLAADEQAELVQMIQYQTQ